MAARSRIRARLFLAFGSVSAMTVVACLAAWLSYDRLGGSLVEMSDAHMPALALATRLAEEGGAISATAPLLVSADGETEYLTARDGLKRRVAAMESLLEQVDASGSAELRHPELGSLVRAIGENLAELDRNVLKSFDLGTANRATMERLRWLQADFLDEAEPLVEDARFNIRTGIETLAAAGISNSSAQVSRLREESGKAEAVLVTNANANLLFGLLARSATIGSLNDLETTGYFLGEISDLVESDIHALEAWPDTVTLRQVAAQLLGLAAMDQGLPALRRTQIATAQEGRALLTENRWLVDRLGAVIAERIEAVSDSAAVAAQRSGQAIELGRKVLLLLALVSLGLALAVAWFYVHHNLLRRLIALGDSARAIAAGDLRVEVPVSGADEITDMAEALRIFRDTAIQVEEANAQAIINNAVAGLLTTDAFGTIEFVNPVAVGLLASPEDRLDSRLPEKDGERVSHFFRTAGENPDALLTLETTGQRTDGSPVPLLMGIRPYRQRQRHGFIVTITDITERRNAQALLERKVAERTADLTMSNTRLEQEIGERRRTEQELREAQAELVQAAKLAALGQVAAGVGHELNQPLAAIRSYAHNGRKFMDAGRTGEAREVLEKISELTTRMADISNHLKRFARRPDAVLGPVEIRPAVDRALSLFTLRLREEDIDVEIDIPPGLRGHAEDVRLEQVFVNLVSNALDAMRGRAVRRLSVSAGILADHKVAIRVADTGSGIPESQRSLVFDPFFTSKEVGAGLGLGLSISYNIVRDFKGMLSIHSSAPEGTVFQVVLDHD